MPDLVQLYAMVATGDDHGRLLIAHLGQSIDGCIATENGDSVQVTGQENFVHLHRLRALSDAIVVGAQTARADDPKLTTRLVEGPSPARVIIDQRGELPPHLGVFTDTDADTYLVCAHGVSTSSVPADKHIPVPIVDGRLCMRAMRDDLADRGMHVVFVEGGGVTVTHLVQADLVDRLHIAVAPVLIGRGRRGLALPSAADMSAAIRPAAHCYRMGEDVLWDLDLSRTGVRQETSPQEPTLIY